MLSIQKLHIVWIDIIDSNLSFSAADSDSEKYVVMTSRFNHRKKFSAKSQKGEVHGTIWHCAAFKRIYFKRACGSSCLCKIPIQLFFSHCDCMSWNFFFFFFKCTAEDLHHLHEMKGKLKLNVARVY